MQSISHGVTYHLSRRTLRVIKKKTLQCCTRNSYEKQGNITICKVQHKKQNNSTPFD